MRRLLELHVDSIEKTHQELRDAPAQRFELTEEELGDDPRRIVRTFVNRVT